MKNDLTVEPRKYPLILILIGTTILAIPAALGTLVLFDDSSFGGSPKGAGGELLIYISIAGFVLFAGYILTAIFKKHSSLLWLGSTLYNLAVSFGYFYLGYELFKTDNAPILTHLKIILTSGMWLLPSWTIFVTIASGYYLKHALLPKKTILP